MNRDTARAVLAATLSLSVLSAQQSAIAPVRPGVPVVIRPYLPVNVPPVRLSDSARYRTLIRAGTLYLTAHDAIALTLENNIDLEVARYNPIIAQWRVTRSEAGGALPGVPSAASQAGSVASGQGVIGSQAAAGVGIPGQNNNNGQTTNATVAQIGPVTQTLDPTLQEASAFSHTSSPQPNNVQSETPVLISDTRAHSGSYQQGFLTGGNATLRFTNNYLSENSPTNILNPSTAASLSFSVQHNLLRGFGTAVNARTITVAKMNVGISDLNFRQQVIGAVAGVLNAYYNLAAAYEDERSKENAAQVAQSLFEDTKRRIDQGSVAPPEAITSESLAVTTAQEVAAARATRLQQEVALKNRISRSGVSDPLLAGVRIMPTDRLTIPDKDDLPPLEDMVKTAMANRADLAAAKGSLAGNEVSALGTKNGVLPNLQAFAAVTQSGLAGTPRVIDSVTTGVVTADPYFVGGSGTALAQVFRRNFPSERAGVFFQAQLRNRQAQADEAIDQLQLRQSQLTNRRDINQVQVDVLNNVVAMQQARVRYNAAVQNRILQEQLFAGEQKKLASGASIPSLVTEQQRDLIVARSSELAALVSWNNARTGLDQALGRTLEANNVSIAEAVSGTVSRQSAPPVAP